MAKLDNAILAAIEGKVETWLDWEQYLPIELHYSDILDIQKWYLVKVVKIQSQYVTWANSKHFTLKNTTKFPIQTQVITIDGLEENTFYLVYRDPDWKQVIKLPKNDLNSVKKIDSVISSLFNLAYNHNIPQLDYSGGTAAQQKAWKAFTKQQEKRFAYKDWESQARWPEYGQSAWNIQFELSDLKETFAQIDKCAVSELTELYNLLNLAKVDKAQYKEYADLASRIVLAINNANLINLLKEKSDSL